MCSNVFLSVYTSLSKSVEVYLSVFKSMHEYDIMYFVFVLLHRIDRIIGSVYFYI